MQKAFLLLASVTFLAYPCSPRGNDSPPELSPCPRTSTEQPCTPSQQVCSARDAFPLTCFCLVNSYRPLDTHVGMLWFSELASVARQDSGKSHMLKIPMTFDHIYNYCLYLMPVLDGSHVLTHLILTMGADCISKHISLPSGASYNVTLTLFSRTGRVRVPST